MRICCFLCCFLLLNNVHASNSPLFMAYLSGNWATFSGYLQIPAGGQPGSTSIHHPSLDELGIQQTPFCEIGGSFDSGLLGFYGIYQYLRPSGKATLDQDLTTHGVFIAEGTSISSQRKFDLYRIGIFHSFDFFNLSIYPEIEATLFNFDYQISTPTVATSRSFNSTTMRIGLGAAYQISPRITLISSAETSISNLTNLQIQTAKLEIDYTVFQQCFFVVKLFLNGAYERINFKDNQTLPNEINVRASPIVAAGIKAMI